MGVCSISRDGNLVTSPTFWMERLTADLERSRGLKEWDDEYFVIPQPALSSPA